MQRDLNDTPFERSQSSIWRDVISVKDRRDLSHPRLRIDELGSLTSLAAWRTWRA